MNSLSRREEDTLLKTTKTHALQECDAVVKDFAACASGRTISVAWACREQLKVVQAQAPSRWNAFAKNTCACEIRSSNNHRGHSARFSVALSEASYVHAWYIADIRQ
ncbi:hypothetical protein B0H34DRAFT_40543 [Crassisporium funariophilum]|nr:hypothetical protein B0H34DRAFT_40543 [Crassisporium funariophilum]